MEAIRTYVRQACERKENIFGSAFYERHLAEVAKWAAKLSESLHADYETVELASYLHDLSAVLDATTISNHSQASAVLATELLRQMGASSMLQDRVARAIRSHSDPLPMDGGPLESVCLSNADAMARISQPAYWLCFVFSVRNLGFEEGRLWLRTLVERHWQLMIPPARDLIAGQYDFVLKLLA